MFIQLDTYFYPRVNISSNPAFKRDEKDPCIDSEISINLTGHLLFSSQREFMADIELTLENASDSNTPYEIEISVFGHFRADEDLGINSSKDHQPIEPAKFSAIRSSVVSMLVGGLREQVATITARQPWGVFLLPSINVGSFKFNMALVGELAEERSANKHGEAGSKAARKKPARKSPRKRVEK